MLAFLAVVATALANTETLVFTKIQGPGTAGSVDHFMVPPEPFHGSCSGLDTIAHHTSGLESTESPIFKREQVLEPAGSVGPFIVPLEPFHGTFRGLDTNANQTLELSLDKAEPGKYFARVCWAASQPADFVLHYRNGKLIVDVSSADIVRTSSIHYTEDAVNFTVHLSPFVLKVIPKDLVGTVSNLLIIALVVIPTIYISLNGALRL